MKILAIDLGKFKNVACLFDTETNQAEYETIAIQQVTLEDLLQRKQPQKVMEQDFLGLTSAKLGLRRKLDLCTLYTMKKPKSSFPSDLISKQQALTRLLQEFPFRVQCWKTHPCRMQS